MPLVGGQLGSSYRKRSNLLITHSRFQRENKIPLPGTISCLSSIVHAIFGVLLRGSAWVKDVGSIGFSMLRWHAPHAETLFRGRAGHGGALFLTFIGAECQ